MEIGLSLTPQVLRLLGLTFPDSLPVLHLLRNGAASSLLSDDACTPSYVIATKRGQANEDGLSARSASFVAATDIDAAARALPRGNLLGAVPERHVDAVLRARPGTHDPRPDGYWLYHRSLAEVPQPVVLAGGARVRRLTSADAGLVNKYWALGGGTATAYITSLIETLGGFGVETSSGELAAWLLRYETEALAMGHTLEQHRKKGYMRAVLREVMRQQQKDGVETTYFYTHRHNAQMMGLGASEGFVCADGLRYWMALE
eukprot:m51a1_g8739 putative glycine n-acyltransferase-like protein 3 (260) ;mRNA; f:30809-31831